jgi:hypothetical protein
MLGKKLDVWKTCGTDDVSVYEFVFLLVCILLSVQFPYTVHRNVKARTLKARKFV